MRGRSLCLAFAGVLLAGCGFRLAGSERLPPVMQRPHVSFRDSYTDFAREFDRSLRDAGAQVAGTGKQASATVDITQDEAVLRVLSVSALNIPTEYELTYTVTVSVSVDGRELLAPQTMSLSRDYSFQENRLLAKENEHDMLRAQMARELASIVLRRLSSLKSP